jgi:methionyl-tRNA formyltransferase
MKLKVVFMGTPDFSVPTLKKLINETQVLAVYTQPDKPVGRGLQMQPSPVKKVALEFNIPVFTPEKVSIPEEVEKLSSYGADFFVIVAYGQILKLSVIELPKYGCINIHSSLLPRWRGAAPIHRSLLAGDLETGITTMRIVPKLDAGDILMQSKTKITDDDTASTLHDRLSSMGADLIMPTLNGIVDHSIKPIVQDETLVTYAHKLTKEMENISPLSSSREIDLQVRTLNPWPGTRIETTSGMKMKIKKGKRVPNKGDKKIGQLFIHEPCLYLQCSDGVYEITEIQEEGKKAVSSHDFLNGLKNKNISFPLELKV